MHIRQLAWACMATTGLLLGSFSAPASATLYRLEAVSVSPSTFSDFSVEFDDSGDGLLQFGEVTSFSGITIDGDLFDILTQVPDWPGVSTLSGSCQVSSPVNTWCFERVAFGDTVVRASDGLTDGGSLWSFTRVPLSNEVPEPSTAALLALAMAGLAAAGRRKSA